MSAKYNKAENAVITQAILEVLEQDKPLAARVIAERVNKNLGKDYSVNKIGNLLSTMSGIKTVPITYGGRKMNGYCL